MAKDAVIKKLFAEIAKKGDVAAFEIAAKEMSIKDAISAIGFGHYYLLLLLDEKKAVAKFGDRYKDYRKKTPSFIPLKLPPKEEVFEQRDYYKAFEKELRTLLSLTLILIVLLIFS